MYYRMLKTQEKKYAHTNAVKMMINLRLCNQAMHMTIPRNIGSQYK